MSYDILRPYDLTALVYVLLLGLRLTISRLVSMHFVWCRFVRILEDMSFLSFLRILILLEEPPHLTADNYSTMHYDMLLITNFKITSILICNAKVILIVWFSCRTSKCEWNLKCESNHHSAMYYVMLLIIHFDITFIFTFKRVGNCVVDRHQNAFPTRSICKCE